MAVGVNIFLRVVPSDANRNDVRLYDPTIPDSGGISASLIATLGALTIATAAGLPIVTSLNATVGPLTLSAAAVEPVTGNLSTTLGALTLSGLGTVPVAVVVPPAAPASDTGGGGGGPIRWSRQFVVPSPESVLRIYYDPKPAKVWPRRVAKVTKEIWYPRRAKRPVVVVEDDDTEELLAILLAIEDED